MAYVAPLTFWDGVRSLFAWRLAMRSGVWDYYENAVTGQRRAVKASRAFQPVNTAWLGIGGAIIDERGVDVVTSLPIKPHTPPPSPRKR